VSSHCLWELARAAAWQPDYIACGPVWPTLTKAMPWRPQGLHNLAWWVAMSPVPVVAIGGILEPAQLADAAACGAQAGCVVRGLQADAPHTVRDWLAAWRAGAARRSHPSPAWPSPSLPGLS
jgi:hydroxymethylpyrimidine kinase/phosphomethylpyrimidine kinase/thiamine-phosphate diphosphorylase